MAAFPYREWADFWLGFIKMADEAVWYLWQEFNRLPNEILLATHMKCFSCTMPTQPAQRMLLGVDRPTMQHRQILPLPENLYIRTDLPVQTESTGNDASPATQHCCSAIRCPMSSDAMNLTFLAVPPSKIYRSRLVSNASWTVQLQAEPWILLYKFRPVWILLTCSAPRTVSSFRVSWISLPAVGRNFLHNLVRDCWSSFIDELPGLPLHLAQSDKIVELDLLNFLLATVSSAFEVAGSHLEDMFFFPQNQSQKCKGRRQSWQRFQRGLCRWIFCTFRPFSVQIFDIFSMHFMHLVQFWQSFWRLLIRALSDNSL